MNLDDREYLLDTIDELALLTTDIASELQRTIDYGKVTGDKVVLALRPDAAAVARRIIALNDVYAADLKRIRVELLQQQQTLTEQSVQSVTRQAGSEATLGGTNREITGGVPAEAPQRSRDTSSAE